MAEKIRRADFSDSLVHLTRERKEYSDDDFDLDTPPRLERVVPAFDVLKEILTSGIIRGSGNKGYVKGSRPAVCFSEIPLSVMHLFAKPPPDPFATSEPSARYRFYGIALSKVVVFNAGGRPVIYLPDEDGHWIPPEEKWRHVRFEPPHINYTHEREWRVPGDLDLRALAKGFYVIVWSTVEAKEIARLSTPVSRQILAVVPMEHITGML